MTSGDESDRAAAGPRIVQAGAALMTVGMAAVIGGILVPAVFLPGTWLIMASFAVIVAGALMSIPRNARN